MTIFGPIPSRRLGESLGVNNIPYKICSYNCVYCQVGRTLRMQADRSSYGNDPKQIAHEVKKGWNVCWKHSKKWTTYP